MTFKHEKGMSGYYVYDLVDPRNNRVFYVGKGRGDRVFQHARGTLPEESQSLELNTIRSIRHEGKLVHCYILRHNLTEKIVESTLSEFFGDMGSNMNELLGKIVSRPHQWNHPWDEGIKTTNIYIHGCPKIELIEGEELLLVSLNVSYDQKSVIDVWYKRPNTIDSTSIYESTRKHWCVSLERASEMDYVLGVYKGIVRSVYKPFSWKEYNKPENGGEPFNRIRCGFEGAFVLDSPYLTTDVSDYPFGSGGAIRYIAKEGWDNVNRGKKAIVLYKETHAAGTDVNAKDKEGFSKLMFAVCNETAAAVEELLDEGADVNAKNKGGTTALMLAVWHNKSASVVRRLLDAGADVNAKNNSGKTALMLAATNNTNPDVVKALLDAGVDVNARDEKGITAIDYLEDRAEDDEVFAASDAYCKMMELLQ